MTRSKREAVANTLGLVAAIVGGWLLGGGAWVLIVAPFAILLGWNLGELFVANRVRVRATDLEGSFAGWGRAVEEVRKLADDIEEQRR